MVLSAGLGVLAVGITLGGVVGKVLTYGAALVTEIPTHAYASDVSEE